MTPERPIRIMRIIARLNVGGPAIHVTLLTARCGPPEFESTLVCGTVGAHEGDMAYLATAYGVHPVVLPELGRELSPLRDLLTLVKLWRLMRRLRPDIVHTHTAKAGFVGRLAAWLARVPVRVHTYHGHVFHGYFGPLKTRLFLALERLTARLTHRLIVISPAQRDELVSTYGIAPAAKFAVVPLGLELATYAETPRHSGEFRAAYAIPSSAPLIGIIGRIVPIKNHALFLEAAVAIQRALPEAHFVIVGDGELRASLEARAEVLGLRSAVTFTGFLRDLHPVYSDLDALVLSSENEGTPVSILEALAAGVPVIATAVGGVPDVLRHGERGQLVAPGDAQALAAAVIGVLRTPPADPSPIQRAVVAEFGITRLVADLQAMYRDLVFAQRRGRRT